jgi:hypothetical protein
MKPAIRLERWNLEPFPGRIVRGDRGPVSEASITLELTAINLQLGDVQHLVRELSELLAERYK